MNAETEPLIPCLCVAGVGLIGGSLALALRSERAVGEVVGCGRNETSLAKAVELGVIDRYALALPDAVAEADMVVLAMPLGAMAGAFETLATCLPERCVITDVGSAKGSVLGAARRAFGGRAPNTFVPGHPIAGTEKSGVEAAFPELFRGRRVILTPLVETDAWAHNLVRRMWERVGSEVVDMGVRHHDEVLAATSHLPHVLAFGLVDTLARMDDRAEIFRYAAGGFRDFTRIASSDPRMWHDICLANRVPVAEAIELFVRDLNGLAAAIRAGESEPLLEAFRRAKHARDNLYL